MSRLIAFFRRIENWPILIIPVVLLLWAQLGAPSLGLATFDSLSYYNSPYRGHSPLVEKLPDGKPGEPIAKHVVLIVIDALREDTSHKMPVVDKLRGQGASRVSVVGQPSLSLPGWTVIGTGAWQEQSGFTTNFPLNAEDLDTLFLSAKRSGLKTALVGSAEWSQLFDQGVDVRDTPKASYSNEKEEYEDMDNILAYDTQLGQSGLEALKQQPDFALLYFTGVDRAGHGYGGTSQQYLNAALLDDKYIGQFMDQIDLTDTAVLITSDHGQVDTNWDGGGGHGGWEPVVLHTPLVAVGKGVKPGQYPDARQADIAPTIAALLGIAIPTHNQGTVLTDMLDAPDAVKAARLVDNADQIATRYQAMIAVTGSKAVVDRQPLTQAQDKLKSGDAAGAQALALQSMDANRALFDAARASRLAGERWLRLLGALWLLLPVGLYGWVWARARWSWKAPVLVGLGVLIALPLIYLVVRGLTYSLTMFNRDSEIETFLTGRVIDALIVLLVATLVVAVWRRKAGPGEVARDTVHMMGVVGAGLMVQILVFFVLWGVQFDWVLPDTVLGFKYYIDVFTSTVFWPLIYLPVAALLPLLAMGVAALAAWIEGRMRRV